MPGMLLVFESVALESAAVFAASEAATVCLASVKTPSVMDAVFWISSDCATFVGKYHEAMRWLSVAPTPSRMWIGPPVEMLVVGVFVAAVAAFVPTIEAPAMSAAPRTAPQTRRVVVLRRVVAPDRRLMLVRFSDVGWCSTEDSACTAKRLGKR